MFLRLARGRDALGEAVVNLSYNDVEASGRDVAQDVLEASAKAYLNAINRQLMNAHFKKQVTVNK